MDFSELLAVAQENKGKSQSAPCYQTKFAPPKKEAKQKVLSANIKKFIARREEEEKQKQLEEKRKKENLLSLRDHKAQSRISKHLKVCKAANKAVIADAIDTENTAITIAGPSQPDEDDYGYESQSSLLYYQQLMNKYNSQPPEKSIFNNNNEKRTIKDIASTKDRVKQALKQQELEETSGERRKRKSSSSANVKEVENEKTEKSVEKSKEEIKDENPKVKKKAAPPTLSFSELLKIAEKKQHEPVMVEVKPKVEEERPMTKRQKKEYIQEKERREQKEKREKRELEANRSSATSASSTPNKPQVNKSLKPTEKSVISNSILKKSLSTMGPAVSKKSSEHSAEKLSKSTIENELLEERKKLEAEKKQLEEMRRFIEEEKRKLEQNKSKQEDVRSSNNKIPVKSKPADKPTLKNGKPSRQLPPADLKPPLANVKPKQFPPADLRSAKSKPLVKKPPVSIKRRIYDEDEEDSDLDGFIVKEPDEDICREHVSKFISEIFNYDKSHYDDEQEEDDVAMESNFEQQMKEEFTSAKFGYMEDLADIEMEKQRKALIKKRKALIKKMKK
ncbi:protein SPT2 homolog [Pseudomyrmex gracilis]|uniref:protein SPT2 homolog n=1 Tax=Pseudomyrmex gracilis TaxID=219809 RepID=UPI000995CF22|nr:protein SPT2 homolog [Pseudomyrmex gracilis]